jgi:hypothetical protein
MANPNVTYNVAPEATLVARGSEVSGADFDAGCNLAASNAPGIGINMGGGAVVGTAEQFTLEDQAEAARTPQDSQVIGGEGLTTAADYPLSGGASGAGTVPIQSGVPSSTGDGDVTVGGDATLATLSAGWVESGV